MTIQEEMHTGEKIIKTLKPSPWGYFWVYFFGVVLTVVLWKLSGFISSFIGDWSGLTFLIGPAFIVFFELDRRGATYYITSKRVIFEYTFLSRAIVSTDYSKIQDLYTSQGVIDRIVGTGKISIETAGSISAPMEWIGIKNPIAVKRLIDQHMTGKKSKESV